MKAYRGMKQEEGSNYPVTAVPPNTPPLALLVRIKMKDAAPVDSKRGHDIETDSEGNVHPGTGGMSVSRSWADLPPFSIPKRLKRAVSLQNFRGASAGSLSRIWSHPVLGAFSPVAAAAVGFAEDLSLRVDQPGHGLVEPQTKMPHTAYAAAIASTRKNWVVDEPTISTSAAPFAVPNC